MYNPLDKDSFTAAEGLVAALKEKMAKPDTEVEVSHRSSVVAQCECAGQ